jgi:NADPH:quinone reductase
VETLLIGVRDLPAKVRAATGGKGADMVFDLVGGVMFRNAVNSLALRGRLVEIAATGQREVSIDLPDFYHNESHALHTRLGFGMIEHRLIEVGGHDLHL